jgi:hypothetical protein
MACFEILDPGANEFWRIGIISSNGIIWLTIGLSSAGDGFSGYLNMV